MLYLGIDQHAMQLTICIRDKSGNITLRRQVSTRLDKVQGHSPTGDLPGQWPEELRNNEKVSASPG